MKQSDVEFRMSRNKVLLQEALSEVERVFSAYKVTFPLSASPITVTPELHNALEHDTYNTLPHYVFRALTTWGDLKDFKHFLPMLLKMIAFDASHLLWGDDLLLHKLRYADFEHWAESERDAVVHVMDCLWQYLLDEFRQPNCIYADVFIRDVVYPERYLSAWEKRLSELPARLHLVHWINTDYDFLGQGFNAIGSLSAVHNRWIIRDSIQQLMENSYLEHMDAKFADEFSRAAEQLKWIREQMTDDLANRLGLEE